MRPLRLKYPPTTAHAMDFARDIVASAQELSEVELDFSPASLGDVDEIIENFRDDDVTEDDIAETLWGFGCYVGEVLRLALGGRWVTPAETPQPAAFGFPLVLAIPGGWWNPIGKVFKRLNNGAEDSLTHFFNVVRERSRPA